MERELIPLILFFFAKGVGDIKLNSSFTDFKIINPSEYNLDFKKNMNPFVLNMMDRIVPIIEKIYVGAV